MDDTLQQQQQLNQQSTSTAQQSTTTMSQTELQEQTTTTTTTTKVVQVDEFLNTGRTGRRNALGDILDENSAYLTTADLPDQLSSLSFNANDQATPSTSTAACHPPSTSS